MKKYQASRGWRNNNPLNIRKGEPWSGLASKQTDKEFCQFLTMTYGYRAGVKILKSYARIFAQRGQKWSVENVVRRWAPENENDTRAYINRVLELMGREGETGEHCMAPLWTKPGVMQAAMMLAAMTCVECDCTPSQVDYTAVLEGVDMAYGIHPRLDDIRL